MDLVEELKKGGVEDVEGMLGGDKKSIQQII